MSAVELQNAWNVRDLGCLPLTNGGETKARCLFRGDALDRLSQGDQRILFTDLKIGLVIDLRTLAEVPVSRFLLPGSVERRHYSLLGEGRMGREPFPSDDPEELASLYIDNVHRGRVAICDSFSAITNSLSKKTASIFHCAAGRDRTGVVTAILLGLAEVTPSAITEDYVASNRHLHEVTRELALNPLYADGRPLSDAIPLHRETMNLFLSLFSKRFGGAREFLVDGGIPAFMLNKFLDNFVNDNASALHIHR